MTLITYNANAPHRATTLGRRTTEMTTTATAASIDKVTAVSVGTLSTNDWPAPSQRQGPPSRLGTSVCETRFRPAICVASSDAAWNSSEKWFEAVFTYSANQAAAATPSERVGAIADRIRRGMATTFGASGVARLNAAMNGTNRNAFSENVRASSKINPAATEAERWGRSRPHLGLSLSRGTSLSTVRGSSGYRSIARRTPRISAKKRTWSGRNCMPTAHHIVESSVSGFQSSATTRTKTNGRSPISARKSIHASTAATACRIAHHTTIGHQAAPNSFSKNHTCVRALGIRCPSRRVNR